jgi:hypothetical protein
MKKLVKRMILRLSGAVIIILCGFVPFMDDESALCVLRPGQRLHHRDIPPNIQQEGRIESLVGSMQDKQAGETPHHLFKPFKDSLYCLSIR